EVEAHVELATRVIERREAAFEGRELLGVRVLAGNEVGTAHHCADEREGEAKEDQDRKGFPEKIFHRHSSAPFGPPAVGLARATGLEPATSGVTGRRSNQLNYARVRQPPTARERYRTPLGVSSIPHPRKLA